MGHQEFLDSGDEVLQSINALEMIGRFHCLCRSFTYSWSEHSKTDFRTFLKEQQKRAEDGGLHSDSWDRYLEVTRIADGAPQKCDGKEMAEAPDSAFTQDMFPLTAKVAWPPCEDAEFLSRIVP